MWRVLHHHRSIVQANRAEVVRRHNQPTIASPVARVHVGAVTVWHPDAHHGESKHARPSGPSERSLRKRLFVNKACHRMNTYQRVSASTLSCVDFTWYPRWGFQYSSS
eukprot:scaffold2133_cov259-Pinguiococcus_pyrenoidosus.AAC.2